MSSSSFLYAVGFCLACAPGLNSIPILVKQAEVNMFPVVSEMNAQIIPSDRLHARFVVSGEKVRDCTFLKAQGYSQQDGVAMKSALTFEDDPTPNASRPTGSQGFGIWSFDLKNQPNADSVFTIITHDCGFWDLETRLGPWPTR